MTTFWLFLSVRYKPYLSIDCFSSPLTLLFRWHHYYFDDNTNWSPQSVATLSRLAAVINADFLTRDRRHLHSTAHNSTSTSGGISRHSSSIAFTIVDYSTKQAIHSTCSSVVSSHIFIRTTVSQHLAHHCLSSAIECRVLSLYGRITIRC